MNGLNYVARRGGKNASTVTHHEIEDCLYSVRYQNGYYRFQLDDDGNAHPLYGLVDEERPLADVPLPVLMYTRDELGLRVIDLAGDEDIIEAVANDAVIDE